MNFEEVNPTRSVHIAFFLPDLMGGGAEKVLSLLANGLAERGLQVDFVLVKARGVYLSTLSKKVQVIDLDARDAYASLLKLVDYLRRRQPAVLFSSLNLTNLIALLAIRLSGTKTRSLIRIANTISFQKRSFWKKHLERLLISWIYPWADDIIAVSHSTAQDMMKYVTVPPSKIHIIYNPIVELDFTESNRSPSHPWLENADIPIVLGIGRLTAQKDFKTLIEAFAILRKEYDARLMILGEGELRHDLERFAESLGIRQDLALPGYVTDTRRYMQRANVFVLSSLWEGLPNVLIESLHYNCSIVSTDCPGGVREILADGKYGILIPVTDPASMAAAIQRALSERKHDVDSEWLEQFTLDRIIDQVLDTIKGLDSGKKGPETSKAV